MKKYINLISFLLFFASPMLAQVAINNDGSDPDASAMLDVKSSNKGVLVPRMSTTSMNLISSPASGLVIFNTTSESFWFYAGSTSQWIELASETLQDADQDTKIEVERGVDSDMIWFSTEGVDRARLVGSRLEFKNTGNSIFIGDNAGAQDDLSDNENIFMGESSGADNTTGEFNVAIGRASMRRNTTGRFNMALGGNAMLNTTGGSFNVAIGSSVLLANTTGQNNIGIGYNALRLAKVTASKNVAIGSRSLINVQGDENLALGFRAGFNLDNGSTNTLIGTEAGYGSSGVDYSGNVLIGYQAGYNETSSNRLYIENSNTASPLIYGEFDTDYVQINGDLNVNNAYTFPSSDGTTGQVLSTDGAGNASWSTVAASGPEDLIQDTDNDTKIETEKISDEDRIRLTLGGSERFVFTKNTSNIGRLETVSNSDNVAIGDDAGEVLTTGSTRNVLIGTHAGNALSLGDNNVHIGYYAGEASSASANTFVGYRAGQKNTTANDNTFLGYYAGGNTTTGSDNTFIGDFVGYYNLTGSDNSFIGSGAGVGNISGRANTAVGNGALALNQSSYANVAVGDSALFSYNNTGLGGNMAIGNQALGEASTGTQNTASGFGAGKFTTTGSNNVFTGFEAGYAVSSGSGNVMIGHKAGGIAGNVSNRLYIDNSDTNAPLIYGDFANDYARIHGELGIGITGSPSGKLHVNSEGPGAALRVQVSGSTKLQVDNNGGVGVGEFSTTWIPTNGFYVKGDVNFGDAHADGHRLSVDGKIACEEVRVELSGAWPDYVFSEKYEMPSLDELADFIQKEKHLPNIPAAAEMEKNGLQLGEMQRIQTEKIEELTLYILQLNERLEAQQKEIDALKNAIK